MAGTKMKRAKTGSCAHSSPSVRIEQRIIKQQLVGALSYWEKVIKITKQNSVCPAVCRKVWGLSKSNSMQFCGMQNMIAFLQPNSSLQQR